jgi:hypothetical protein
MLKRTKRFFPVLVLVAACVSTIACDEEEKTNYAKAKVQFANSASAGLV